MACVFASWSSIAAPYRKLDNVSANLDNSEDRKVSSPAAFRTPGQRRATAIRPRSLGSREDAVQSSEHSADDQPSERRYSLFNFGKVSYNAGPNGEDVYEDTLMDKLFIWRFSIKIAEAVGAPPPKSLKDSSYESFVDLSFLQMKGRGPEAQMAIVMRTLNSLLPPGASDRFKAWFPPNKFSCEANAAITGPFFGWLVGPSSVEEVEVDTVVDGSPAKRTQKSLVYIHKCRYLAASNCTGMCVNMCKKPTETFFKETFGLPLYMEPQFDSGACKMIFGQEPPPEEEDPAYKYPCRATCSTAVSPLSDPSKPEDSLPCHKLQAAS